MEQGSGIAIVGMACEYPDARTPRELWENVLAQRRAFRRIPVERLNLGDYFSSDRSAPDRTYALQAAVIEGYEFDRARFRVAGSAFRASDLTHWLALDVASRALADAGFAEGRELPREATGVLLGNSLTGEFSRAALLRLRWPYVRRVLARSLAAEEWPAGKLEAFLENLEELYKSPFAPVGEESLAGGLSNTIAGRVCNHFDLKGGGYTVDGACSSSLLAVASACNALAAGQLEVALAGGVDLSLDPFEIVGFAKTGALAQGEMRVYDARSAGFIPGEGCGWLVLMRRSDAEAQGRRIYAVIRGWGISSDGSGGITRPEVEGQILALRRAYRAAGFGPDSVSYIEGHGTGTGVGDATELKVLSLARREAGGGAHPCAVGSIKALIGHTKAAAGAAGLIKAAMVLHEGVLPPTAGSEIPHPELTGEGACLRTLREAEPWPASQPLRAGVSSMGFGGINVHLALEKPEARAGRPLSGGEAKLSASHQDAELLLLRAVDREALIGAAERLGALALRISRAELIDLAAELARSLGEGTWRAALIVSTPSELAERTGELLAWLREGAESRLDAAGGVFLGSGDGEPRIGFLFPGQGSPSHRDGGAALRRFAEVRELYAQAALPTEGDDAWTAVAQPAIVTASRAGLRILDRLGIAAEVALGHSLGELTALHWGGAYDETALIRIAGARGRAMAGVEGDTGTMAGLELPPDDVPPLLAGEPAVVSGWNGPRQVTISGETEAVRRVVARAKSRGVPAVLLKVSHAFHSPLMGPVEPELRERLRAESFLPLRRRVASTVTGGPLSPDESLEALLCRQLLEPVRFVDAVRAAGPVDLFIEVGPGRVLAGLVARIVDAPVVSMDAGGPSIGGILRAAGAAFAAGAPLRHESLFGDRFTRPFDLSRERRFFTNPCELAPLPEGGRVASEMPPAPRGLEGSATGPAEREPDPFDPARTGGSAEPLPFPEVLELVRAMVAERVELPPDAVRDDHRLLDDLHLNSIVVGQLAVEGARRLGLDGLTSPTDFADATVFEMARALDELARTRGEPVAGAGERSPAGVDSWVRAFRLERVRRAAPRTLSAAGNGRWEIFGPPDDRWSAELAERLPKSGRGGIAVRIAPDTSEEETIRLLLRGAKAALASVQPGCFVLVQSARTCAGFVRSLHQEAKGWTTVVVEVPEGHPRALDWVLDEVNGSGGYCEAAYDESGERWESFLRPIPDAGDDGSESAAVPGSRDRGGLGAPSDSKGADAGGERLALDFGTPAEVLLVTGGGKGIAAECALDLARKTGVRLALLGRSLPEADEALAANLRRMAEAGAEVRYYACDVTDARAVRASVRAIEEDLGPITGFLHAAGANTPQLIRALDEAAIAQTVAPKVSGARHVLACLDPGRLRLFVAFGSIIARTGLRGEADYALANEWLTQLVEEHRAAHPQCRCLSLEWSVWSGVGMGERLGRVETLVREGVTPITVDQGIALFHKLLGRELPATAVIVTGRFGEGSALRLARRELPLRRFLERTRVDYPGVELVAEADLSLESDPYVRDHVLNGEALLPAVMGLEAMAQAASAVLGAEGPFSLEAVEFRRPVVVPQQGARTIRLAALARGSDLVEVALRSDETGFQSDHFRARCRFGKREVDPPRPPLEIEGSEKMLPLDPARDLYGPLLFHQGRFRRLDGYRALRALECEAVLRTDGDADWFDRFLPGELLLGDPAARDAAIHAVQACLPHLRILPIGVDRLWPGRFLSGERLSVRARERSREGRLYVYDLEVIGEDGSVRERWEGLRLHAVEPIRQSDPWSLQLLVPYLERRLAELWPEHAVRLALEEAGARRDSGRHALSRALGRSARVSRRPDGKPLADRACVSVAHAGAMALAVASEDPVSCDVEVVVARDPSTWKDLLGPDRFRLAELVATEANESLDAAATRLWCAGECLKKCGVPTGAPVTLAGTDAEIGERGRGSGAGAIGAAGADSRPEVGAGGAGDAGGWVRFTSGRATVATYRTWLRSRSEPLVLSFLLRPRPDGGRTRIE